MQPDTSISAYTYERTLVMEQRNEFLKQMNMTDRQKRGDVQHLLSRSFSRKSIPTFTPLDPGSPPADITIQVPQFPPYGGMGGGATNKSSTPPSHADNISIGDLSVEPRVLGGKVEEGDVRGKEELIDLSSPVPPLSPEDENITLHPAERKPSIPMTASPPNRYSAPLRTTPPAGGRGNSPTTPSHNGGRVRKDSGSSSDESCPEEQSVRTPLLEGEPATTLPVMNQPSIKHYDDMFAEKNGEEEIPLGGTADSLVNQP